MKLQHYIRPALYTVVCTMFLVFFYNDVIKNNPVFGPPTQEAATVSWDEYLADRQRRNIKKMNLSYDELMEIGDEYAAQQDWRSAIDYYFNAKTVFPTRMTARRSLCYALLMQCSSNGSRCNYAKREIYYASRQINDFDPETKEYIQTLVKMTDLEEVVEMEESDALASIF